MSWLAWMLVLSNVQTSLAAAAPRSMAIGDVVNIRARPDERAGILVQVPIGTGLEVDREEDGWARVRLSGRPADHPLVGWVRADLVGTWRFGAPDLLARATAEPGSAALWEARAAALDPWSPDVVARRGPPAGPIWVGACDGERVWLVGKADARMLDVQSANVGPNGGFLGFAEQEALRRGVSLLAWYQGGVLASAGRFATPFLAPVDAIEEDETGDGWGVGGDPGPGVVVEVVLGACAVWERGQIYSTVPLQPLATAPGGARGVRAGVESSGEGTGVSGLVARAGPLGGLELLTLRQTGLPSCTDGESEQGTGTFYSWVAADGAASDPFVVNYDSDVREGTGGARWFTFAGQTLGFVLGSGMDAVATAVHLDARGHATVQHLPFRYFGC